MPLEGRWRMRMNIFIWIMISVIISRVVHAEQLEDDDKQKQKNVGLEANRTYLIVVTDPHGFYSGHRHNEKYTADYASLSSFADKLKQKAATLENCEVFFFENGDMVDGGGLTDEPQGKELTFPILDEIGFDARTFGNHELYVGKTIQALQLPGVFVTSNVVDAKTRKPFGARYKVLPSKLKNGGNILVFGFLYDMTGYDSTVAYVESVESSVRSDWFQQALTETKDVRFITVLAHMDYRDALTRVILNAVRSRLGASFPVVFVTGHTHIRRSTFLDPFAFSFETGRFMDTVGVLSMPSTPIKPTNVPQMLDVRHDYLDANADVLFRFLGDGEDADTETSKAKALRKKIRAARDALELDRVVGYSPFHYSIEVGLDDPLSLVTFWVEQVVPKALLDRETHCEGFFLGGSGTLRYDLLRGPVVVDDLWAVDPFKEGFQVVRCVPGNVLKDTIARLPTKLFAVNDQRMRRPFHPSLPLFVHSNLSKVSSRKRYDLVFGLYESQMVLEYLNKNAKGIQFTTEPFRQDEDISSHSVWVKYFTSKKRVEDTGHESGFKTLSEEKGSGQTESFAIVVEQ